MLEPFEQYLLAKHKADILHIVEAADMKKHFSINISFVELCECDSTLGNNILKDAEDTFCELEEMMCYVQDVVIYQSRDSNLTLKLNIHARVYDLPDCPEFHRTVFPKTEDMDLFLQITGTVVRATASKVLEFQRLYICTKCKHTETVQADYIQKYILDPPKKCSNPVKCAGTNLVCSAGLDPDNCRDYQEIKIQEQASKMGVGIMPNVMWVTLEDDLVDACKPGDDVTICGVVKRRWGAFIPGKRIDVALVLKANHIQVNNGQIPPCLITPEIRERFEAFWEKYKMSPLDGRDLILKSFCPKLYGMSMVKLAMALVLAGGSRSTQGNAAANHHHVRSEPHILLVGDPGMGKSQLLRYAATIIPRSVLTTGVGTTSAGLTVAAVMEDGQWQLESGALVLADGGVCCIDEFNSMKPHDRASIHEAMEQQTISVAKASIVSKLRTRCSIIAATNPKGGHLDRSLPLSLNLAMPSPLLSRFDIVLILKDPYDSYWDNLIADHILSGTGINAVKIDESLWNLETLQQYFAVIRNTNPVLTAQSHNILASYFQAQRRATSRNKARTTARLLDSLVRLSQAHARLMFHTEVHVMDALFAVLIIESSMNDECSVLSLNSINVQEPFLPNPMKTYSELATAILTRLELYDILESEVTSLQNDLKPFTDVSSSEVFENILAFGGGHDDTNNMKTGLDKTPQPGTSKQLSHHEKDNKAPLKLMKFAYRPKLQKENVELQDIQMLSTANQIKPANVFENTLAFGGELDTNNTKTGLDKTSQPGTSKQLSHHEKDNKAPLKLMKFAYRPKLQKENVELQDIQMLSTANQIKPANVFENTLAFGGELDTNNTKTGLDKTSQPGTSKQLSHHEKDNKAPLKLMKFAYRPKLQKENVELQDIQMLSTANQIKPANVFENTLAFGGELDTNNTKTGLDKTPQPGTSKQLSHHEKDNKAPLKLKKFAFRPKLQKENVEAQDIQMFSTADQIKPANVFENTLAFGGELDTNNTKTGLDKTPQPGTSKHLSYHETSINKTRLNLKKFAFRPKLQKENIEAQDIQTMLSTANQINPTELVEDNKKANKEVPAEAAGNESKRRKLVKVSANSKNSIFEDYQMLNLIPSANDGFDIDLYNLLGNEESTGNLDTVLDKHDDNSKKLQSNMDKNVGEERPVLSAVTDQGTIMREKLANKNPFDEDENYDYFDF